MPKAAAPPSKASASRMVDERTSLSVDIFEAYLLDYVIERQRRGIEVVRSDVHKYAKFLQSRVKLPEGFTVCYGWILKFMNRHGLLHMDCDVLKECVAGQGGQRRNDVGVKRPADSGTCSDPAKKKRSSDLARNESSECLKGAARSPAKALGTKCKATSTSCLARAVVRPVPSEAKTRLTHTNLPRATFDSAYDGAGGSNGRNVVVSERSSEGESVHGGARCDQVRSLTPSLCRTHAGGCNHGAPLRGSKTVLTGQQQPHMKRKPAALSTVPSDAGTRTTHASLPRATFDSAYDWAGGSNGRNVLISKRKSAGQSVHRGARCDQVRSLTPSLCRTHAGGCNHGAPLRDSKTVLAGQQQPHMKSKPAALITVPSDAGTRTTHASLPRATFDSAYDGAGGSNGRNVVVSKRKSAGESVHRGARCDQMRSLTPSLCRTHTGGSNHGAPLQDSKTAFAGQQQPHMKSKPAALSTTGSAISTTFLRGCISRENASSAPERRSSVPYGFKPDASDASTDRSTRDDKSGHCKSLSGLLEARSYGPQRSAPNLLKKPDTADGKTRARTGRTTSGATTLGGSFHPLGLSSKVLTGTSGGITSDMGMSVPMEDQGMPGPRKPHRLEGIVHTLEAKQRTVDAGMSSPPKML